MPNFRSDEIYKLEMYNRTTGPAEAYCDLLVIDDSGNVYIANLIGTDTKMKQMAWLMQEGKSGQFYRAEGGRYAEGHMRRNVYAISEKKNSYDEEVIKIDDMTHMFMVASNAKPDIKARSAWQAEENRRKSEGLGARPIPAHLSELIIAWDGDFRKQVYDVLNDRYNTPMLEEWSEFVIDALIDRDFYEPLSVLTFGSEYELQAGLLRVSEEQLEEIITEGIQGYELDFAIEEDGREPSEGVLSSIRSIDTYLSEFAGELGARIQENIGLQFNPDQETHHPAFKDVNLQANQNGITGLYPPQANTVMGVSKTLAKDDFCFIIGEMG